MDSDTETERKAKEDRDPFSMNDYALKTEMGTLLISQNKAEALKQYLEAAKNGSVAANYNIGDIYEKCADDPHLAYTGEYNLSDKSIVLDSDKKENPNLNVEGILRKRFSEKAKSYYMKAGDSYPPTLYRLGILAEKEYKLKEAFKYYYEKA